MAQYQHIYTTEERIGKESIKYFFVSNGKSDVIKVIEYQRVQSYAGGHLYNLAFGDYDIENDMINDQINTNNGDHYAVFNTVLRTVPIFFEHYPDATLMVQGSDNSKDFIASCRVSCSKKCDEYCKNTDRRIRTYRYYVNKNYEELTKEYLFYGGIWQVDGSILIENYELDKEYDSVFCKKASIFTS